MPNVDSELARVAERLSALVDANNQIKQTADDALRASNDAKNDILVETTRLDGEIKLLQQGIDAQTDKIRAEVWKDLYQAVWKPIAIVAVIVGLLSAGANGLTTWLVSTTAQTSQPKDSS